MTDLTLSDLDELESWNDGRSLSSSQIGTICMRLPALISAARKWVEWNTDIGGLPSPMKLSDAVMAENAALRALVEEAVGEAERRPHAETWEVLELASGWIERARAALGKGKE